MTTLAITPNWKNKSAKFKGTVAAGEHVSVTILNDDGEGGEFIEDVSTLRLRVVNPCNGRTLAIFPEPVPEGETSETWDADLSPLRCTLNLNTVQMLKAVPPEAKMSLLWVLDDYDNNTLYFKEQFEVTHWPRLRGEEEPTDLDNYKDIIAEFDTRLTTAEQMVATAATNAQNAAASASAAAASAATAATAATDAQAGAIASKNAAQLAATAAATSATNASTAETNANQAASAAESARQAAATSAAEAAESAAAFVVDDTLSVEGAAADAKAVGDANQDLITRIETVQDNLDDEVAARETLAAAVGDNRQNLAAEIARAQGAEQGLENRKADKTTTYTKEEVDAAVAAATPSDYDSVKARLAAAEGKIPTQASTQNQLADKAFVNSSVATATATFRGTSDAATQTAFEAWLDGLAADANDYVFWRTTDAAGNTVFKRYKYNGAEWEWEFDLNNSSFTAEQWAAISSGITSGLVAKLGALPTAEALAAALAGKQDALTFDNAPTKWSNNPVKSGGIWSMIWGALSALPTGFSSLYDWVVSKLSEYRDKTDLNVYGYGIAYVTFPAGYSITYGGVTYSTETGKGIEFYGPISSTAVPQYNFWVPYEYKDATDFNLQAQTVWCLYGSTGSSIPATMMYGTGATYYIANWDTEAPTLTLSNGEATGGEPTMTRPIGATGDTLAKVSQLAGKLDKSGGTVTGEFRVGALDGNFQVVPETTDGDYIPPTMRFGDGAGVVGIIWRIVDGGVVMDVSDALGNTYRIAWPSASGTLALTSDVPYALGTPTVIDTASSEVVEGETVNYGAATLANRTANIVQVTAALDELRITFPAATSGKVRDFGLRVEIGTGSAALAAPALVPIAPTGETIKIENNAAEIPALADGTATAKGVTLLYFSETAPGVFVVKGEQVEEVA